MLAAMICAAFWAFDGATRWKYLHITEVPSIAKIELAQPMADFRSPASAGT
jgi:hypothetical protein